MALPFFAPKPNRAIIGATHLLAAPLARIFYDMTLSVSKADLAQLTTLCNQRVIYLVNHPSFDDPISVMLLSAQLRKGFYYLASVEQFSGRLGRYFQSIGSYSVRRGQRDRASIKQTLALLSQPETHLVIFPEGGCSFQNDTVMPFRPGAIQLAFQSMQRQLKQGQAISDCYIVPLALKYRYGSGMEPVIRKLLRKLEQKLQFIPLPTQSGYERLRAIAFEVMTRIARDYGLPPPDRTAPFKIDALRCHILDACESALGICANEQALIRERTYQIEAVLNQMTGEPSTLSRDLITRSIFRLFNFNAIYDGYVAEQPTAERFVDTLTRFEREVFEIDRPRAKNARVAKLGVGPILNLKDSYHAYETDRSGTIDRLCRIMQQSVQTQIDRFAAEAKHLKF